MYKNTLKIATNITALLYQPLEMSFESASSTYGDEPSSFLKVTIEHEKGEIFSGEGFHNGGSQWYIRFLPLLEGKHCWSTKSSDAGLNGQRGEFLVKRSESSNRFQNHGPIRVAENQRTFEHLDGTPFFWLGEGLWAAAQQAYEAELDCYFSVRKRQGFSAVQFNTLLNWEGTTPYLREPFRKTDGVENVCQYNYDFFDFLDIFFEKCALNDMLALPAVLWFNYLPGEQPDWYNPAYEWPVFDTEAAYRYGRFLGARYGAYPVAWLISADLASCDPQAIEVLEAAVRGLQDASFHTPLISSHIAAKSAYHPLLVQKDWFSFYFIQSGHRKDSTGFPAAYTRAVRKQCLRKPVVNGEMFFENLGFTLQNETIPLTLIRRAAWESFFCGANAGISYGAHGLWCWYREEMEFRMEYLWKKPTPWEAALELPGPLIYSILKEFMLKLPWYSLEEAPDLVIPEAGQEPATACRLNSGQVVLVYLPANQLLRLTDVALRNFPAVWFNPENGASEPAALLETQGGITAGQPSWNHDAVLMIGPVENQKVACNENQEI